MFTKLINGEFRLKVTFWKYGVLGLLILNLLIKISGGLLGGKLKGVSIIDFYTRYTPTNFETSTVVFTVFYLSSLFGAVIYSIILIVGTWRSSAEYDKSIWLRYLSRILIVLMVYTTAQINFKF